MRAALLHDYGQPFSVEDVDRPTAGHGEVIVEIAAAGVCHSDLHIRAGRSQGRGSTAPPPWILGHENTGWIAELGAGVTGFEIGEPVAVHGGWGCGSCRSCLGGYEHLCNPVLWNGLGRQPGGYAEAMLVPGTRALVRLGDYDPVLAAPLTDAGLSAYSAVLKALPAITPGSVALVIGSGGLGQYAIQFLKQLSGATVMAIDLASDKRDAALTCGADYVADPQDPSIDDAITELTHGLGTSASLDFVGVASTMQLASRHVGHRGTVVIVGLADRSAPFTFVDRAREAILTTNVWGSRNQLEEVIAFARTGRITTVVEQHLLTDINLVFDRLELGAIRTRAVLIP